MLIPFGNHEDPGVKKMLLDKEATKRDLERIPFFPPLQVHHLENVKYMIAWCVQGV